MGIDDHGYPLLITKAERKGRTREEVLEVTAWLTGYSHAQIEEHLALEKILRK